MENLILNLFWPISNFREKFILIKYYGMNGFRENYQGLPILKAERD